MFKSLGDFFIYTEEHIDIGGRVRQCDVIRQIIEISDNSKYIDSSPGNKRIIAFATKSAYEGLVPHLLYSKGKQDGNWRGYYDDDIRRKITIPEVFKFDVFNDNQWPEFKIFFRKLIEKELSNESLK